MANNLVENEKIKIEDHYRPSEKILGEIYDTYRKFTEWKFAKESPKAWFRGQSINRWLQEAREKFWGYLPLSDEGDPQFFLPETRNQVIELLSRVANLRTKASFFGVTGFGILKATLLRDMFSHWNRHLMRKYQNFLYYLYKAINGTVVVYVGFKHEKKDRRVVTKYDDSTGETQYKIEKDEIVEPEERLCNLEDIFIPKLHEPDIQKQEEIIEREVISYNEAKSRFGKYPNFKFVVSGAMVHPESVLGELISANVLEADRVEIIRHFNSSEHYYKLIMNGVLLNPITRGGNEEIAPSPWNHGKLPYAKEVFEYLDPQCFFGIGIPQKCLDPQDALNLMYALFLDREQKAVSRPILTNDPQMEEGVEFRAGRVYQVGADVQTAYRELDMDSASPAFQSALISLQGIIDRAGSGGVTSVIPSRQPQTATAHRVTYQKERTISGMYYLGYEHLLEQIAWLTIKNMIQFYTSSIVEKIVGERKFNQIFSLNEERLVGGGIGTREVRITDRPRDSKKLREEAIVRSLLKKERVEIIEVTPQHLRELSFDIRVSFDEELTPEGEQALFMDWVIMMMNLFGQHGLVDPKKLAFRAIEKQRENPADIMPDTLLEEYNMERFGIAPTPIAPVTPGQLPALNRFNQSIRGQIHGAAGAVARDEGGQMRASPSPNVAQLEQMFL